MPSQRQIDANRSNSRKSTGPKTVQGKLASRRNALSHGLSARQLVVEGESPGQMELVIAGIIEELCPQTMLEAQLAEQIAHLTWRMRRIPAFESAIFAWIGQNQMDRDDTPPPQYPPGARVYRSPGPPERDHPPAQRAKLKVGRLVAEGLNQNLIGKLGRYEAHLVRQLSKLRAEFEILKIARQPSQEAGSPTPNRGLTGET